MSKYRYLWNTVKYLKFIQVYYQIYYRLKIKFNLGFNPKYRLSKAEEFSWTHTVYNLTTYLGNNTFNFLNRPKKFQNNIDWNFPDFGKLWVYNLNYFEYLNQKNISKEEALQLVYRYIDVYDHCEDGKEPYPTSLRILNIIKFVAHNDIEDEKVLNLIKADASRLYENVEYHLLANHLLENGFALLFVAQFFNSKRFLKKATTILTKELEEQVLKDGAHFELSPMYHILILHRILDCIQLLELNKSDKSITLLSLFRTKAEIMLSWINQIKYNDDSLPMFNDSSKNITISIQEIFKYAKTLRLNEIYLPLSESGYRKFQTNKYQLVVDFGDIGPNYQPAHAHSDTFNFELFVDNKPIIVDTGTSTYDKNERRQLERSTYSHNTIQIDNFEQSEVWGGFRVARRAYVKNLKEGVDFVEAEHDGYKKIGVSHLRRFSIDKSLVQIKDIIVNDSNYNQTAYFHLHPSLKNLIINDHSIIIENNITMIFTGTNVIIHKELYEYAEGFNKIKKAIVIKVTFESNLETSIKL